MKRATRKMLKAMGIEEISIHALVKRATYKVSATAGATTVFQSTPS